jgi:hypothetical protein
LGGFLLDGLWEVKERESAESLSGVKEKEK